MFDRFSERGWAANVGSRGEVMFADLLSSSFYQAMAPMKKAMKAVKAMKVMKAKRTNTFSLITTAKSVVAVH